MVFSSFEFLFRFLPAFLIIYFITPKKFRNAVLFLGSIAFYTYGEAQYVLLLLASVTVNYVIARSMYKTPEDGRGRRQAVLLVLALCYDFGMLFFFKYSGLTTKLPLGISFYTFQIAAYVIDVYRGIVPAEKSYVNLGTYLTMFPQLIAGPIVNYTEVSSCLKRRTVTARDFESGVRILVIGLGSKVIIADRVGMLWNNVQTIGFNSISTPLAWLGAVAYSMELYFDFAGYSMMAIGLGKMIEAGGHLVKEGQVAGADHFVRIKLEAQKNGFFDPFVRDPIAVNFFRDAKFSLLKQFDDFIDGVLNFRWKVFGTKAERFFNNLLQCFHSYSSKGSNSAILLAASVTSGTVATKAIRM